MASAPNKQQSTIGDLGGAWLYAFRLILGALVGLIPLGIGLAVWLIQTTHQHATQLAVIDHRLSGFVSAGPRWTPSDAAASHAQLRDQILSQVRKDFPPAWLIDRLDQLALQIEATRKHVDELEDEFTREFVRKDELPSE